MSGVVIRTNKVPQLRARLSGSGPSTMMDKIAFDLETKTKENIVAMDATDTLNMLNTTNAAPELLGVGTYREVRVPAEYAGHVHDGHSTPGGGFVAGRPFMSKAVDEVVAEIPGHLRDLVRG